MSANDLSDVMTIEAAARAVHMKRERVRDLAVRHRIAIEWGGGPKRTHLRVKLSELTAAILSERHQPRPARQPQAARRRPRPAASGQHPLVRC